MTAILNRSPASNTDKASDAKTRADKLIAADCKAIKGKGAAERRLAFMGIAPASFSEHTSRNHTIAVMHKALGTKPSELETANACREWLAGRIACRLPAEEFPKDCVEVSAKLDYARELLLYYAAPAKQGAKPRRLRGGQIGRRSAIQHRVIRNAEEALSVLKAELGIGGAQTQSERKARNSTKGKRAPHRNDMGKGKIDPANMPKGAAGVVNKPTLGAASEVRVTTRDSAIEHIAQQAASLLAFANKNAKLLPTDFGAAIQRFKADINAAMNAEQERKAKAEARAAEMAK